jgi:hypothetical protein
VPSFFRNTTSVVIGKGLSRLRLDVIPEVDSPDGDGLPPRGRIRAFSWYPPAQMTRPGPLEFFFLNMARCHGLTSLHIDDFDEPCDLDLVARSCPRLGILGFGNVERCYGTLKGLSSLEELYYRSYSNFSEPNSLRQVTHIRVIHLRLDLESSLVHIYLRALSEPDRSLHMAWYIRYLRARCSVKLSTRRLSH